MNGLDFAIVIALSIGAIYGLSHGAIRMFTSVLALFGGIYFASIYYPNASALIEREFATGPTTASVIGYLVLFAALFFVIEMVGTMLMRTLTVVHLSWFDRLIGAALGASIAAIATGMLVTLMAVVLPSDAQILRDSQLAPRLMLYNEQLVRFIPANVKQAYEEKRGEIIRGWVDKETRLADAPAASPQASPSK